MDKPICLCGEEMTFQMDNKKYVIWKCQNCGRLLLRPKDANWQRWFIPEKDSREVPNTRR